MNSPRLRHTIIRTVLSFMAIGVAGCDAVSQTELMVEAPIDLARSDQFNADVLAVVSDTASQFGFRFLEHAKPHIVFTDTELRENTTMDLEVHPGELFVRLRIDEMWTDRRSSKHRKFVEKLVSNLRARGLRASVTSHTTDSIRWTWFVAVALCAVMARLLWRRFMHKSQSLKE